MSSVCIAGKSLIAIETLKEVCASFDGDIYAVANRTDDGHDYWQPSYKRYCEIQGIRLTTMSDAQNIPDLVFISVEFDRIIRPDSFFKGSRFYNIHFSALPSYKGMFTSHHPIKNGEKQAGCTLHLIDSGIDTGAIIDQTMFDLAEHETAKSLYSKYLIHGTNLVKGNLASMLAGTCHSTSQQTYGSTYYSKSSVDYSNISIDLNQTCFSICNQIRSYIYRDYQIPKVFGKPISAVHPALVRSTSKPGTVVSQDENTIVISTVDFDCRLTIDHFDRLIWAVTSQNSAEISRVVEHNPFLLSETTNRGWTPLIIAAYNGLADSLGELLRLGADPDLANQKGTTPLMYAKDSYLGTGNDSCLVQLIAAGADTSLADIYGRRILDYVPEHRKSDLIGVISKSRPADLT